MTQDDLIASARAIASGNSLEPELVCAICEQESAWNPWAIRYEDAFYSRYIVPLNLKDPTEARSRAFSFGLMQVLGEVAREFGFTAQWLTLLCDPELGLEIGCKVFAHKLAVNQGNVHDALQAWNGGSNASYADQVISRVPKYKLPVSA